MPCSSAFVSFAAALLLALPAPAAKPITLDGLLAQFRALPGLEAKFREEKRMSLLATPLISEGTLHFAPPDRLVRRTVSPSPSTVLIEKGALRFGDGQSSDSIPLDSNPVVRLFVDSFLKILEGDRPALEKIFALHLQPRGAGWELTLKPKLEPMTSVIEKIVLHGTGIVLSKMTIAEPGGDETVTTFSSVDTARKYSPDELPKIFKVP